MTFTIRSLICLVALTISSAALATTRLWIGGTSGESWDKATNWSPSGVPVQGDELVINDTATIYVTQASVGALTLHADATLDLSPGQSTASGFTTIAIDQGKRLTLTTSSGLATLKALISGKGEVHVDAPNATISFNGNANTYTGGLFVDAGTAQGEQGKAQRFGADKSVIHVSAGAVIDFVQVREQTHQLVLDGGEVWATKSWTDEYGRSLSSLKLTANSKMAKEGIAIVNWGYGDTSLELGGFTLTCEINQWFVLRKTTAIGSGVISFKKGGLLIKDVVNLAEVTVENAGKVRVGDGSSLTVKNFSCLQWDSSSTGKLSVNGDYKFPAIYPGSLSLGPDTVMHFPAAMPSGAPYRLCAGQLEVDGSLLPQAGMKYVAATYYIGETKIDGMLAFDPSEGTVEIPDTSCVWVGEKGASWDVPTNWENGLVPTAESPVRFNGNAEVVVSSNSFARVVTIDGSAEVMLKGLMGEGRIGSMEVGADSTVVFANVVADSNWNVDYVISGEGAVAFASDPSARVSLTKLNTYKGGTVVRSGIAYSNQSYSDVEGGCAGFGKCYTTLRVEPEGKLLFYKVENRVYNLTTAGEVAANSHSGSNQRMLNAVSLAGDALFTGSTMGVIASGYGRATIALNGYAMKLALNVSDNIFHFVNTQINGEGVIEVAEPTVLDIREGAASMPDATLQVRAGAQLRLDSSLAVKNLAIEAGATVSGNGTLQVTGELELGTPLRGKLQLAPTTTFAFPAGHAPGIALTLCEGELSGLMSQSFTGAFRVGESILNGTVVFDATEKTVLYLMETDDFFERTLTADGAWEAPDAWSVGEEFFAAPEAGAKAAITIDNDEVTTVEVNLAASTSLSEFSVEGRGALRFVRSAGSTGVLAVTGEVEIATDVTLPYGLIDFSHATVSLAPGKTITFVLDDVLATILPPTNLQLFKSDSALDGVRLTIGPEDYCRGAEIVFDSTEGAYKLAVTAAREAGELKWIGNEGTLNKETIVEMADGRKTTFMFSEDTLLVENEAVISLDLDTLVEIRLTGGPLRFEDADEDRFKTLRLILDEGGIFNCYGRGGLIPQVIMNGGMLANLSEGECKLFDINDSIHRMFPNMIVTADSFINARHNFGSANTAWNHQTLELNGYKLTKLGPEIFHFRDVTYAGGGTIETLVGTTRFDAKNDGASSITVLDATTLKLIGAPATTNIISRPITREGTGRLVLEINGELQVASNLSVEVDDVGGEGLFTGGGILMVAGRVNIGAKPLLVDALSIMPKEGQLTVDLGTRQLKSMMQIVKFGASAPTSTRKAFAAAKVRANGADQPSVKLVEKDDAIYAIKPSFTLVIK